MIRCSLLPHNEENRAGEWKNTKECNIPFFLLIQCIDSCPPHAWRPFMRSTCWRVASRLHPFMRYILSLLNISGSCIRALRPTCSFMYLHSFYLPWPFSPDPYLPLISAQFLLCSDIRLSVRWMRIRWQAAILSSNSSPRPSQPCLIRG